MEVVIGTRFVIRVVCLVILASLASGCVPALREPPSLEELAGITAALSPAEADRHLRRAEARFAERTPASVRTAAELWTRVAEADPARTDALVGAVRARIWLVDHEENAETRRREATAAVQTAQWCERRATDDPACTYWLGAALGVQARERRGTALDALPRIAELFRSAAERNAALDNAGPYRALALLYVRAPGWPSGPGDPDLGLEHARKAVEIRPAFPPNLLALGEALRATEDSKGADRAFAKALEIARERERAGDPDAADWVRQAQRARDRR